MDLAIILSLSLLLLLLTSTSIMPKSLKRRRDTNTTSEMMTHNENSRPDREWMIRKLRQYKNYGNRSAGDSSLDSEEDDALDNEIILKVRSKIRQKDKNRHVGSNSALKVELTYPKFIQWASWSTLYSTCDPDNNAHLSPININTSDVIPDKETPTLFVYSRFPIKEYKLSLKLQTNGDRKHEMDALNIQLTSEKFQEATYVSGLGDPSYRFFSYALFLFAKDKTKLTDEDRSRLSLHRFNDEEFPLEIVMYFATQNSLEDTTQVHIMVNISESDSDNPLFFPIIQAAETIHNRIENYRKTENAVLAQLDVVEKLLDSRDAMQKKRETDGFYKDIKNLASLTRDAIITEDQIETDKHTVNNLKVSNTGLDESIKIGSENSEKCKAEISRVASIILSKKDEEAKLLSDEAASYDFQKRTKIQTEIQSLEKESARKEAELANALEELEKNKADKEGNLKKIEIKQNAMDENKEKIKKMYADKGFSFTTTDEANTALIAMYAKVKEENVDKRNILKQEKILKELNADLKTEQKLEYFQASWLLPPTGGYYIYNGSLPVPPCTKRAFTIVMKNPIFISESQFDKLSSMGHLEATQPMDTCLPILAEQKDRKVWYNRKNLQFILDDAVHMKSKKRKKLKLALKANQPSVMSRDAYYDCVDWIVWITMIMHRLKLARC